MLLEGKVAVVTGGSRGIGLAIVKKFVSEGAKVALCGSTMETAQRGVDAVLAEYPDATVMACAPDLTSEADLEDTFRKVAAEFGSLDIVANNAGISQSTPLLNYTEEEYDKIMDLNVKGVFNGCQAAARVMLELAGDEKANGVIINTSSMVSDNGQPSGCCYPASKYAVNGLTHSLARELGPKGIRVNAVAPGITATDMVANLPEQMIQPMINAIPLRRIGEPEDVANAILFLASDMASYVTSEVLHVTGAMAV